MLRNLPARIFAWVRPSAPFGTREWVTVSVAFILAVTLWFLVTLNTQSYTTNFRIPVKLSNFPGDYQLVSDFPDAVDVMATGPGIKLLYQQFDPGNDTLVIDYLDFQYKSHFLGRENLALVDAILEEGVHSLRVSPDSISLLKQRKTSKKVPVLIANVDWNLPASYRLRRDPLPMPDSVLVIGPEDSLKKIETWGTLAQRTVLLEGPTTLTLALDTHPAFTLLPTTVSVTAHPEPFTEMTVPVAIRTTNVPHFTELFLDPDTIMLKVLVALTNADSLRSDDFAAEVDYNSLDERSPYLLPNINFQPHFVEIIEVSPRWVKYIIITRSQ